MQAIIMAGGKGRRLLPYTTILPKPLIPVGEAPILEIMLRQLSHYGFTRITLAVGYLAGLIQAYFGDGKQLNLKIEYSKEEKNLGTIGPLTLIDNLDEDFLVMNGDILTDFNFRSFFTEHQRSKNLITIASYTKKVQIDLGVLETNDGNLLAGYQEKPVFEYQVSMGIYAVNQRIVEYLPYNEYLDIPTLMLKLLKEGVTPQVIPHNGRWLDIGRKEDYEKAHDEFEHNKKAYLPLS